ncbi:MAG: hypothetical protein SOT80_08895 [Candidatus Pseudoruminococcus sp.]|uniref:DUF3592 domain-containing protein n=1 Tax=Candidatus Pseudoruminococcus sp. TaxID=3101048 RepID=UPI002A7BFE6D|nr:DUF3592 domain-containing protein [Ruminococcus sp.]MDY2783493.1 hypothetical protein [Candidatus Pseudoruminococcus sp.]
MSIDFKDSNTKGIILFIIASLVIIAIAFFSTADYSKGRMPVEATIIAKERRDKSVRWYAIYTVDGKTYKSFVNGNGDDIYIGRKLTLYYDENNPSIVYHSTEKGRAIFVRCLFISFPVIILTVAFITSKTSKKKRQQLEESGELQQYQNPYEDEYQNPYENNNEQSNSSHIYNDINKF